MRVRVRVRVSVRVSAMRRGDLAVLHRVGGCKGEGTRLDVSGPHGGGAREGSAHLLRARAGVGGLGLGSGLG